MPINAKDRMNIRVYMMCVWCGPAYMTIFLTGLLIAGLFPPPRPSLSALETAHFYAIHANAIRFGTLIAFSASVLYLPFCVVISQQLRKMEGRFAILADVQLTISVISLFTQFFPPFVMLVAAFRPERSPEITQFASDLAWILNIITINCFIVQYIVIAVAIFSDRSPEPVMPRWVAYVNLWVCFVFLPGQVLAFVYSGPFAWQGLLSFYAGLVAFGVWFWVMFYALRQAIKKQEHLQNTAVVLSGALPA